MIKQNHQGQIWQNHANSEKSKMPRSRELSPSATDWGTITGTIAKRRRLKKSHKLEIIKVYNTLTSNTEEIYRLRNHNKLLVMKIKKLKSTKKADNSNEDIERKVLEKQVENQCLINLNQEWEKESRS